MNRFKTKETYGKKEYKLDNINKGFLNWMKEQPRYSEMSTNQATKKLFHDIKSGYLAHTQLQEKANGLIKNLEAVLYGKKKKSNIFK